MSGIDKTLYADAEEIAAAIGKKKRHVQTLSNSEKWVSIEEKTRSRYPKKWFLIKRLPVSIAEAVFLKRYLPGVNHGPSRQANNTQLYGQVSPGHNDGTADRRNSGNGNTANHPSVIVYGSGQGQAACDPTNVVPGECAGVGGRQQSGILPGAGGDVGSPADRAIADSQASNAGVDPKNKITGPVLVAANGARPSGGEFVSWVHAGLPGEHRRPINTDEKQRITDGARQYILNFVSKHPDSLEKAVAYINQGFADGSLDTELHNAVLHCNDKANEERIGALSARTLQRWANLRSKTGSCIPMKTRVKTDWRSVAWLNWYFGFYRKPQKPGISEAYKLFADDWAKRGLSDSAPSEFAVRRLLKSVPKLVLEWGRSTGAEYRAMQAFTRRDWSGSSNEIWVGDGHSFKAKVRHPDAPDRLAFTPEVTVIIDAASRFIVGWAFSLSENQIAVSEALGNAMVKHGKPLIYYSDNGAGQTAKTIDCPAGGMLARLGIHHETGIPGNPQGRGILEGMWDITAIYAARQFPTFQGTGMDKETLRKNTVAINAAKNKNGKMPDNVPHWEEFIAACEARFEWYNAHHKHSALGGKTPAEVYYANFDESWACHLTDDEKVTLYRPFKERTPSRGEIKHLNNVYFHSALAALPANTKVRMYYDIYDPNQVWVTDLTGVPICVAEWNANSSTGFPVSLRQKLKIQRAKNKKKLGEERFNVADTELNSLLDADYSLIEAIPAKDLPGMRFTAEKVEAELSEMPEFETEKQAVTGKRKKDIAEMVPAIPAEDRERYFFWRSWNDKAATGQDIPDGLQLFMQSYPTTAKFRAFEAFYNPKQNQESQ